MGLVLAAVRREVSQQRVVAEMAARCAKHVVLASWRALRSADEAFFVDAARKELARLSCSNVMAPLIVGYFVGAPSHVVVANLQSLFADRKQMFLDRVAVLVGLKV